MDNQNTPSKIEIEIQKADELLSGLHYFLQNAEFFDTDPKIRECMDELYKLDSDEYRASIGQGAVLDALQGLLVSFITRALVLGVKESEITDEKLLGYNLMQKVDSEGEGYNIRKSKQEGKNPDQILIETLFKRKIH